jgi:hypothetical protein
LCITNAHDVRACFHGTCLNPRYEGSRGLSSTGKGGHGVFPQPITDDITPAAVMTMEVAPVALQIDVIKRAQATDPEYQKFAASAGADFLFDYEDSGVPLIRSPLDEALRIVVSRSLQPRLFHLEHFPIIAGHPRVTRIFRTLRKRFFWKVCLPMFRILFVNTIHARGIGSKKELEPVALSCFRPPPLWSMCPLTCCDHFRKWHMETASSS